MKIIIVAAVSLNNVIGFNNKIPWSNKQELNYFRELTIGHSVLMGRKTFDSIGKPLEGRINIVISSSVDKSDIKNNLLFFPSINSAINYCVEAEHKQIFVIGGSEVYEQTIELVDEMYISRIQLEVEGDKYFPSISNKYWKFVEEIDLNTFVVEKYLRIKN